MILPDGCIAIDRIPDRADIENIEGQPILGKTETRFRSKLGVGQRGTGCISVEMREKKNRGGKSVYVKRKTDCRVKILQLNVGCGIAVDHRQFDNIANPRFYRIKIEIESQRSDRSGTEIQVRPAPVGSQFCINGVKMKILLDVKPEFAGKTLFNIAGLLFRLIPVIYSFLYNKFS